ncbi:MAG: DinB family protein [Holophagales bacterium]|nr:DinB family protein [Holophagales bacterium]
MKTIDLLAQTRKALEQATRPLSPEHRSTIPRGFANHIWWHVGHLVVTQQILCYRFSGLPMHVDTGWLTWFAKGSSPTDWPADVEVPGYDELTHLSHELVARLRTDYDAGLFDTFESYTTSAGVTLETVEDALRFNNFHEGIHLGYVLALRRAVAAS